jgi:hypothetical protein
MANDGLEAYQIANDLKLCIMQQLLAIPGATPEGFDACVTAGAITWDNCCPGSLRVTIENQSPTERFPDPVFRPTVCSAYQRLTDIRATILRCAPTPNADGDPPPCNKLEEKAQELSKDMDALWRAVACCFNDTDFQFLVRSVTPIGPQGACVGTTMLVSIGLVNWCNCDG